MHLSTQELDWIGLSGTEWRPQVVAHRQDQGITLGSLGSGWVWVQIQPQQRHCSGKSSNIQSLSVPIYKLNMAITYILLVSSHLFQGVLALLRTKALVSCCL